MAGQVYALLAGVNDYGGRLTALDGSVDDIRGIQDILEGRLDKGRRHILPLLDHDATRDNIIGGFTGHLAAAGADDVALFYFSGHGSQEPVEKRYWHLEPTGRNQTIVCSDSRTPGVPDLADKELNELISTVAAGGAHVLVVLDCCHAGGGTRDPGLLPRDVRARLAPPAERPRVREAYLEGFQRTLDTGTLPEGRHVALSACESTQLAVELPIGAGYRGVFSAMLQYAVTTLGPATTYRELLGVVSAAVRDRVSGQYPIGHCTLPDDLDRPVLGGAVRARRSTIMLEHYRAKWWIDAGAVHGLQPPRGDDTTVLAVLPTDSAPAGAPLGQVRVTELGQARCEVRVQEGWEPDSEVRYHTVVTDVPLPAATVELRGDRPGLDLVRARLGGSPHVREGRGDPGVDGDRFLVLAGDGELTIARADAEPLCDPVPATLDGAGTVAARLEHLTRWHLIKRLDNPVSTLAGQVRLEVLPAEKGEQPPVPGRREPIAPAADGHIHLHYRRTPAGRQHPYVFLYVHNDSDRDLYCAILDLTDRFRCHSKLLPGELLPAGKTVVAFGGRPVDVAIPKGRLEAGGTEVFDWLKVIAAEQRFTADAYDLPNLDGTIERRPATRGRGPRTILDRLADRAVTRDAGDEATTAPEWTTALTTLRTTTDEPA